MNRTEELKKVDLAKKYNFDSKNSPYDESYFRDICRKEGIPIIMAYYAWHLSCGCEAGMDILQDCWNAQREAELKGRFDREAEIIQIIEEIAKSPSKWKYYMSGIDELKSLIRGEMK